MNVTKPNLERIVLLQEQYNIKYNNLLNFYLFCLTNKSTTYSFLIEHYNFSEEDIKDFEEILLSNNIIKIKDIPKKVKNKNDEEHELMLNDAASVIEHLSSITGKKMKITTSRVNLILKWIKEGYTIKDFIRVNLYFNMKWRDDPQMNKYVRIETLYNSKFITRIEEASSLFEEIEKHKKDISQIINVYQEEFIKKFGKEPEDGYLKSLKILDQLVFWISHYPVEDIVVAIRFSFFKYIVNETSLLKILKGNFAKRIEESKNLYANATQRFSIGGR